VASSAPGGATDAAKAAFACLRNKEFPLRPVLIALLFTSLSAPALAQDDFKQLPEGAGRAETVKVCSQCHSPELVANQRLDEPGWRQVVNQMANNGAQGTDAEFETIIKYLAATFPPN
jgi:mono/diheme cytochrome c family protein